MELMDKSLDKLYSLVYNRLGDVIPEVIVGKMAEAVSQRIELLSFTVCLDIEGISLPS